MRVFKRTFAALALIVTALAAGASAQTRPGSETVIVLPFENTTNQRDYNWIGASFSDSLTGLFAQAPGLNVVSTEERELIYQRLRLPLTSQPSRATAIKIAREAKASIIIIGGYGVKASQDDKIPSEVSGTARVVRVNEGQLWRSFDFGGAVTRLQHTQGTLAFQILYTRDEALTISLNDFLKLATKVPPRAFESFVKGVMTDEADKRSNYLQNALKEFAKVHPGEVYPEANFELGNLYHAQEKWKEAADHYSKLKKGDPHYAESAFYAGLSYWHQNDLKRALEMLVTLTTDMPLTGVFNNAGAISLQAARGEKDAAERDRLLKQAADFLERAKNTVPDDATVLYNYAQALLHSGKFPEAAQQLRDLLTLRPRDGEAFFLYAKALERAGQTEQATAADNEARRYLAKDYAKYQTAWQKSQSIADVPLRIVPRLDIASLINYEQPPANPAGEKAQDLLEKARKLYVAGLDDEVLPELNRVLMIEPMNAEAHLYIGRVYQRRGDLVRAISSLKTSLFWDAKLVAAHVLLGRIFLEKGDRAQAMTHARTAIELDPNNQEAVALYRQVETGAR